jgi:hypothetical protein
MQLAIENVQLANFHFLQLLASNRTRRNSRALPIAQCLLSIVDCQLNYCFERR